MNDFAPLFQLIADYAPFGIYAILDKSIDTYIADYPSDVQRLIKLLHSSSFTHIYTFESSESNKNLVTVEEIWSFLVQKNASRHSLMLGIGGGVTSDIAAFVASTFHRGIDLVLVPTTLLATVDASIGGKTGFNFNNLKNYIGTFYSPIAIFPHTGFLQTLPPKQLFSGFGEMFKTALLNSKTLFDQTVAAFFEFFDNPNYLLVCPSSNSMPHNQHNDDAISASQPSGENKNTNGIADRLEANSSANFENVVRDIIATKERLVAIDPHDLSIRHALNLGHTVGHAIEELNMQRNTPVLHGIAVMHGLLAELYISQAIFNLDTYYINTLTSIVKQFYGRPTLNCKDIHRLIDWIRLDKKTQTQPTNDDYIGGFSLLSQVGKPEINVKVKVELVEESLDFLCSY